MTQTVGLTVVRIQPLHEGHQRLIHSMISDYDVVLVGLGSTNKSREKHDPWTVEERQKMLRNVYGDRIKIVQLQDIGTTQGTNDWVDYVLEKIQKLGLPAPHDYISGSEADAVWYANRFFYKGISDQVSWNFSDFYISDIYRNLYIKHRKVDPIPSATEIRSFLETRKDNWKQWVPRVNWDLIESTYPESFKVTK